MSDINQRTLSIRVSKTSLDWNVTVPLGSVVVLSGRGTFVDGRGIALADQMFNKRYELLELDAQIVHATAESDAVLIVEGVRTGGRALAGAICVSALGLVVHGWQDAVLDAWMLLALIIGFLGGIALYAFVSQFQR